MPSSPWTAIHLNLRDSALALAGFIGALTLSVGGCAHAPQNQPIQGFAPAIDYRPKPRMDHHRRDDLFMLVFFSGGGMRAAAFSYGVLEEMQATSIVVAGNPQPLARQI